MKYAIAKQEKRNKTSWNPVIAQLPPKIIMQNINKMSILDFIPNLGYILVLNTNKNTYGNA